MTGWRRLAIVLSVIWWAFTALLAWVCAYNTIAGEIAWEMGVFVLVAGGIAYAIAAALWWALAGFWRG